MVTSPLQGERGGILQTANNYLAETLSNIRQERTFQRLKPKGFRDGGLLVSQTSPGCIPP